MLFFQGCLLIGLLQKQYKIWSHSMCLNSSVLYIYLYIVYVVFHCYFLTSNLVVWLSVSTRGVEVLSRRSFKDCDVTWMGLISGWQRPQESGPPICVYLLPYLSFVCQRNSLTPLSGNPRNILSLQTAEFLDWNQTAQKGSQRYIPEQSSTHI